MTKRRRSRRWVWVKVWEGILSKGIQAQRLHSSRQGFISALLIPSPIEFFLIAKRRIWRSPSEKGNSAWHGVHVVQAIILHCLVVEPWTIARLPLGAANHTKLGPAPTRHVVTALFQFDGGGAIEAALPALLLRNLGEPQRRFVFGAFAASVPFAIAGRAHFGAAPTVAFAVLTTRLGISMDICRFDPFTAPFGGTVNAVFGGIFLVFLVPLHFEAHVEELLNVFERYVVLSAAFGWHMLGVGHRQGENPPEAGIAHTVFAR